MKKIIVMFLLMSQVSNAAGLFGNREAMTEENAEKIMSQVSKFMVMSAMSGECVRGLNTVQQAGEAATLILNSERLDHLSLNERVQIAMSDVDRLSQGQYKTQLSRNARSIYPVVEIIETQTGTYKRSIVLAEDYVQCM